MSYSLSNKDPATPHVVFSGGGTGGHLFPGLAVAERLRDAMPNPRITFCGTGKPFERQHVFAAGFQYRGFPCQPRPVTIREAWRFFKDHSRGIHMATDYIRSECVSLVVGLGGYASLPMARAASRCGVPTILLEQNAVAGRATRWLAPSASLVCLSIAQAKTQLSASVPVKVTGNPVRRRFIEVSRQFHTPHPKRLIVLGGSQGADDLNQSVPRALHKVRAHLAGWQIIHQSGSKSLAPTEQLYQKLSIDAKVTPFLEDLPDVLGGSDLAICRAGGTTLAELAVCAVPAILLPLPHAADDHQRINAAHYTRNGAAVTVGQGQLDGPIDEELGSRLMPLLDDDALRRAMVRGMSRQAIPHAAEDIAAIVRDMVDPEIYARAA